MGDQGGVMGDQGGVMGDQGGVGNVLIAQGKKRSQQHRGNEFIATPVLTLTAALLASSNWWT